MKYQPVFSLHSLNDSNFAQWNIPIAKPHMGFRQNAVNAKGQNIYRHSHSIPLSICILIGYEKHYCDSTN